MNSTNETKNNITEGVIWKQILIFFFPILIGTFFQQLYNTVDAVIVGRYAGKEALSSVSGSASQFINFIVGFFTGLSAGSSVYISQFFGAKDQKRLDLALHTSYAFAIVGGIVFGAFGFFASPHILKAMNTPATLIPNSALYLQLYFLGLVFVFVYNIGSAILRAIGDAKRPLYILMVCCFVNIVLDMLLVKVMQLGVKGVAIATLISQGISAILVTWLLVKKTPVLQLDLKRIRFETRILDNMLRLGLPSGIQSSLYNISNILIQVSLNALGVDTVAAWGATGKIDAIIWLVYSAFGIAITTFVGQNYGAHKFDRIRKGTNITLVMCMFSAVLMTAAMVLGSHQLLSIFTTDSEVTSIGTTIINLLAKGYWAFVFVEVYAAVLQAEGTVLVPTIITLCGTCLFRIVWIKWIVPNGTLTQILSCYPMTWITCGILFIIYFHWKQKRILKL